MLNGSTRPVDILQTNSHMWSKIVIWSCARNSSMSVGQEVILIFHSRQRNVYRNLVLYVDEYLKGIYVSEGL